MSRKIGKRKSIHLIFKIKLYWYKLAKLNTLFNEIVQIYLDHRNLFISCYYLGMTIDGKVLLVDNAR